MRRQLRHRKRFRRRYHWRGRKIHHRNGLRPRLGETHFRSPQAKTVFRLALSAQARQALAAADHTAPQRLRGARFTIVTTAVGGLLNLWHSQFQARQSMSSSAADQLLERWLTSSFILGYRNRQRRHHIGGAALTAIMRCLLLPGSTKRARLHYRSDRQCASRRIIPALEYLTASNRVGLGDKVKEFDNRRCSMLQGKHVVVIGGGRYCHGLCAHRRCAKVPPKSKLPVPPRPCQYAGQRA